MAIFKGLIRDCVVCGAEYRSPQSHARVLTCSRECGYKHRVVVNKASVELQCKHCGKTFTESPSHAGRRVYCSHECKEANSDTQQRKALLVGERNGNWKGNGVVSISQKTGKAYRRQQPHLEAEKCVRRKRAKDGATPAWIDLDAVKAIYAWCRAISHETGVEHHVDHIVPLTSSKVCGLHVQSNLQVLPGVDNLSKHNRSWPDMW